MLVYFLIAVSVAGSVFIAFKKWRCTDTGDFLSLSTCICVLAFNTFSGTGAFIPSDLHHPFENINTYFQIVQLGQKPYTEFYPPSGMFAFLQGFFFDLFGRGQLQNYYVTQNLFYLFIAGLVVFALALHIKREYIFFICLIFSISAYNRFVFILPLMLLLAWPRLIERKNLWLKVWFLTSYLHGLYYPIYGAAVCLGFLPLGIYQIITFVKSGELKQQIKKASFWLWWGLCFLPVLWGIPLLLGMLQHTVAMAEQSIWADGIARFGLTFTGLDLFLYLQPFVLRLILWYLLTFVVLALVVWVAVALCLHLGKVQFVQKRFKVEHPVPALLALSCAIIPLVSFSYSVTRLESNNLLSRNRGPVYAVAVFVIILAIKHLKSNRSLCLFLGVSVFFLSVEAQIGLRQADSDINLYSCYTVPEGAVYVENDPVQKWGTCFVSRSTYDSIEEYYETAQNVDREKTYLQLFPQLGHFYMYDVKGAASIVTITLRGYSAMQESVDMLRDLHAVVGPVDSSANYYLHHWLLTSGEYIWDDENQVFLPNGSGLSPEAVRMKNKAVSYVGDTTVLYRISSSLGSSMSTLRKIFSQPDIDFSSSASDEQIRLRFDSPLDGDDADFLYLEFDGMEENFESVLLDISNTVDVEDASALSRPFMKKDYNRGMEVTVQWHGDDGSTQSIVCAMGKGKLLIPLGAGRNWLLNSHSEITISVTQDGTPITIPVLDSVQLLKLREIPAKPVMEGDTAL